MEEFVKTLIEYSEWLLLLGCGGAAYYTWSWLRRRKQAAPQSKPSEQLEAPRAEERKLELVTPPKEAVAVSKEEVFQVEPSSSAVEKEDYPPRKSFGAAIQSWIPLLKEKSKDKDRWEEVLIMSDMGPRLTDELVEGMSQSEKDPADYLKSTLKDLIAPAQCDSKPWEAQKPLVLFIVGVNGVGKTTSLVKLAYYFHALGKTVGVVGADTFRKAAVEQLERGCQKVGAEFFTHRVGDGEEVSEGADPSAVIFDGVKKFSDREIVLVDTSGRLHTKKNLMEELKKMKRVADKAQPGAPHESWLIIDATLGQNALSQAKTFHEAIGLTGLILTKMDGLSRGGTIFQLFQELRVPIRFLGVGETPQDLEPFDSVNFVEDLFDREGSYS